MTPDPTFAKMVLLNATQDLRRCSDSKNPFDQLTAAAIVRRLFLDEGPVVDQANTVLRHQIRFRIASFGTPWPAGLPEPTLRVENLIYPPDCPPHWKIVEVKREAFFAHNMGSVSGNSFSVKDLVRYLANSRGGVHLGKPDQEVAALHATLVQASQQAERLSSTTERLIIEGVLIPADVQLAYRFLSQVFAAGGLASVRDGMRSISRCVLESVAPLLPSTAESKTS